MELVVSGSDPRTADRSREADAAGEHDGGRRRADECGARAAHGRVGIASDLSDLAE